MTPDELTTPETETTEAPAPVVDTWAADSDPVGDHAETDAPESDGAAPADATAQAPAADRGEDGKFKAKGKGKPRSDPQARVEQATSREAAAKEEARLARQEAAELKQRLEALERQSRQPETPKPAATPSEKFTYPTYAEALAQNPSLDYDEWRDAKEEARTDWKLARVNVDDRIQQRLEAERAQQAFLGRYESFAQSHPDYDEVVARAPHVPGVMLEAVRSSPRGPEIAYDLGSHPEDCAQLAAELKTLGSDAVPLVRRLLESRLTAAAVPQPDSARVVPRSSAAPPVNRVGGSASAAPVDPEDLEFGPDYIRLENAREKQRRAAGGRW
jgi:hypothetical protein